MVNPHHVAHWYPTAAYLYILWLDALALAWEYLRRHPDYRLDWVRRARRPDAAYRWGLRLLEDPALDARDAHPAWLPGHAAVVQLYPDADPPPDAARFDFWNIPGHKHLLHDGKRLALIARSPGHCQRYALAFGLEDGMAVAYAHRGDAAAPVLDHAPSAARTRPRPTPAALLELHTLQALDATLAGRVLARRGRRIVRRRRHGRLVQRRRPALQGTPPGAARRCADARRLSPPSTACAA
ncbi:hypothetical protein MyNCGM70_34150 [Achromobacter xylosoxidans]